MRPPQGFGSEDVAATVILASSHFGFPLSTTQVVSGAVTGSGVGRPGAAVDWGVAGRIVVGWLLTLPAAAATGRAGLRDHRPLRRRRGRAGDRRDRLAIGCTLLFVANRRSNVTPEETISENPAFGTAPAPRARGGMTRLAEIEWDLLFEAAWISVAVGLGVMLVAAVAVVVLAAQPGREGRGPRQRGARPERGGDRVRGRRSRLRS